MTEIGKNLEFISWIRRDGSGTDPVKKSHIKILAETIFEMQCLSINRGTWIASGFNSFVVKIKPQSKQ